MRLCRLELIPRVQTGTGLTLAVTAGAVAAALFLGALMLALSGISPWAAYAAIFRAGLLGGPYALSDTAVKATPLLLCGLGCAVAFRARLWNVGAEGQLLLGAWAATGVAYPGGIAEGVPAPLLLPLMALCALLAGGAWGGIAGALRARLGVNEIISSLMLVYIAQHLLKYFIFGPWSEGGFPLTPMLPRTAWLPRLSDWAAQAPALSGLTAHAGLLLGIACCAALHLLLKRTAWGFELRVMGESQDTARYMGVDVASRTFWTMVLSGALAGLAGFCEVAGVVHRLQDRFSPGYGFVAIAVAWLSRLHPWGVLVGALLFGALLVGAKEVQPAGIAHMLQGVLMLVTVAGDLLLRFKVRLIRAEAAA